jgi:archaellum component FlaC
MKKIELEKELERVNGLVSELSGDMFTLKEKNDGLEQYVLQLRNKLQEVSIMLTQYEKTVLLMAGRIQEKDNIISEQNNNINRRSD